MEIRTGGKRALATLLAAAMLAGALPLAALAAAPQETGEEEPLAALFAAPQLPQETPQPRQPESFAAPAAAQEEAEETEPPEQLSLVTDELGNTALYGFDGEAGLLRWVQGPEDTAATRTSYLYDGSCRLAALEKAVSGLAGGLNAIASRYGYENGRLASLTHSNTETASTAYRFFYDEEGRLTEVQVGGRTLAAYRYGSAEAEEPAEAAYGNGDTVIRQYDEAGRLASSQWNGDARTETCYRYDAAGRPVAVDEGPDGAQTRYEYDAAGHLTAQERTAEGFAQSVQWEYDGENHLTGIIETQNGARSAAAFSYDAAGCLVRAEYGSAAATYTYGSGGRLMNQTLLYQGVPVVTRTVEYLPAEDGQSSSRVAAWSSAFAQGGAEARYTYDGNGNIRTVWDGAYTTAYTYDEAGQLVREDNQRAGKSWVWTYDAGGNILQKAEYAYTQGALGEPEQVVEYAYQEGQWGDLLQRCGGRAMESDGAGNLLEDGVWSYRWACGRQLAGMTGLGRELAFAYDAEGRRTQKTVDGTVWQYAYVDGKLTCLTNGTDTLRFGYDGEGAAFLDWNGEIYFCLRDLQGDVVGLVDAAGCLAVEYAYDAWGAPLAVTGPLADTLGRLNPLRYRGYIYDTETGLYYLGSRYYDPQLGRFISADEGIAGPGGTLLGGNLFAYGLNNPVNTSDPEGSWPRWVTAGFAALSAAIALKQQSLKAALTALAATAVYRLQVVHFDVRAALNIDIPCTREEAIAAGWLGPDTDPVGPSAMLHQFTSRVFGENVKYVSPDGCREAIYDAWGRLIADVRDIGTYNFSPSGTLWGDIRHFFVDMVPWLLFGNDDGDPGPVVDGLVRLFR